MSPNASFRHRSINLVGLLAASLCGFGPLACSSSKASDGTPAGSSNVEHDPVTYEPNDSPDTAAPIDIGTQISSAEPTGDWVDYYRIDVTAGHIYTLEVMASKYCGGTGMHVSVLQGADGKQGNLADGAFGLYEFTPTATGPVLIDITKGCNDDIAYTLQVLHSTDDGLKHDPITYEPNDSPSTAAPIDIGTPIQGSAPNGEWGDYYRMDLTAGHIYTLEVSASKYCGGTGMHVSVLQGIDGKQGSLADGAFGTYEFTPTASGPVLIDITKGCNDDIAYTFQVLPSTDDGLMHDPVTFEPNDSPSTAAPIELNTAVVSSQPMGDPIDDYRLQVTQGRTYTLSLTSTMYCGGTGLSISVAGGEDGKRGKLLEGSGEFVPLETGPVLISVGKGCVDEIPYTLKVLPSTDDGLMHDPLTYEPNDSPSTAAPIAVGMTVSSSQPIGDPIDYYRVPLEGAKTYTLTFTGAKSCGGTGLSISISEGEDGKRGKLTVDAKTGMFSALETGPALVAVNKGCTDEIPYTLLIAE